MLRLGRYQEAHLLSERSMSISGNAFWPAIRMAVANLALGREKAASDGPVLMLWTVPATGIAMCHIAALLSSGVSLLLAISRH